MARSSDNSALDIRKRFDKALTRFDERPQPVVTPAGESIIVTGEDIRTLIVELVYKPITAFKGLAMTLEQIIAGNTTRLVSVILDSGLPSLRSACPTNDKNVTILDPFLSLETRSAVACGDGEDVADKSLSWWSNYIDQQHQISALFGAVWSTIRVPCSRWPFRANWSFKGPFTTPKADASLVAGRPAAPILFLTNRLDPVTPLRAARAMAKQHPGAQVVVQEAMGHCALGSAPSKCVAKVVAEYFESGTVPDKELSCEADCGPWDDECRPINNDGIKGSDAEAASIWFAKDEPIRFRRLPLGLE